MDAMLYIKMLSDKSITNLRKLQYKYSSSDVAEFVQLLKDSVYTSLPLPDFHGNSCMYLKNIVQQTSAPAKILQHIPTSGNDRIDLRGIADSKGGYHTKKAIEFSHPGPFSS